MPALDGLRFLALVRVVSWHATGWPWTTWMVAAVPSMFVVTGYLIAQSAKTGGVLRVQARRLSRLFPPFLLFSAFVLFLSRQSGSARGPLLYFVLPFHTPTSDVASRWLTSPLWYVTTYFCLVLISPVLLWLTKQSGWGIVIAMGGALAVLGWDPISMTSIGHEWLDLLLYSTCAATGIKLNSTGFPDRRAALALAAVAAVGAISRFIASPPIDGIVNNDHILHLLVGAMWLGILLANQGILARVAAWRISRHVNARSLSVYLWHPLVAWLAWNLIPQGAPSAIKPVVALAVTLVAMPVIASVLGPVESIAQFPLHLESTVRRLALGGLVVASAVVTWPASLVDLHGRTKDQPLPPSAAPVIAPVNVDPKISAYARSHGNDTPLPSGLMQEAIESHNKNDELGGIRAIVITRDGRKWAGTAGGMDDWTQPSAVGSITKTFTTALVMSRVKSGSLSLDQEVGDLGVAFGHPHLTLRQLLTHTSGIPRIPDRASILRDGVTPEEVARWTGSRRLEFEPGSRVVYATTGFAIVGLFLERLTGESFEDLVTREISEPLGYDLTFFRGRYRVIGYSTGGIVIHMDELADWMRRYALERNTPGGTWDWELRGSTGLGVHSYCPCVGRSFTALGHMGGRTFASVDADGTTVVIDSRGVLVNKNFNNTQSLAQELRLLAGGGHGRWRP